MAIYFYREEIMKHVFKGIASGIIWGLGQIFNKQYLKAAFFFVVFAVLIVIELFSSRFLTGYDPYSKIPGDDFDDAFAARFHHTYNIDVEGNRIRPIPEFDLYCEENGISKLSIDNLIEFIAVDLVNENNVKFYLLSEEASAPASEKGTDRDSDLYPGEDDAVIGQLIEYNAMYTTYMAETNEEYYRHNRGTEIETDYIYINIDNPNDIKYPDEVTDYIQLHREGRIFANADYSKFYNEVVTKSLMTKEVVRYENITDRTDFLTVEESEVEELKYIPVSDGLYYYNDIVYGYFNPNRYGAQYQPTAFTEYFSGYLAEYNRTYQANDQDDIAKFKLRIYFEINPDAKAHFEEVYDNFFYDRAGFFLKGIWSVITLGSAENINYYQIENLSNAIDSSQLSGMVISKIYIRGHISSYLLIRGLISTLLLGFFMIFYVWGIRDAYKTSVKYQKSKHKVKDSVYFKELYESSFEYIVLSPAFFAIVFISIMPIIFGFLIAFTSYNGRAADIGLFDWVGFKNFLKVFSFGSEVGLPFGKTFWRVFLWTVIWSVFSTLTVFFGGFFQAIVINSERVPFKKFWRTLLILPWAVPAIISQMVFANFFNEYGVVNNFLNNIGVYDLFKQWGMLAKWSEFLESGLPRILYMGHDNIQWFGNPHNPWFVRIVLIIVNIWLGFPFYMALMSSVMTGIDRSLYEAADIDGASKGQKFKYITFPLVLFSTAPLLIMCFSGNFNNFGMIYFTTQGGANKGYTTAFAGDTDILISWMYTLTVEEKYYNMASVFSILIFLIVGSIAAWNYARTKAFKED